MSSNYPLNVRHCLLTDTWSVLGEDGWSYTPAEYFDMVLENLLYQRLYARNGWRDER